jgi:hypothetical protein
MLARAASTAAASRATARALALTRSALLSTASAAAATSQAPIPRAEPFRVCAKARRRARILHICEEDHGLPLEQAQHLGFEARLPDRHARQVREIDPDRLGRRGSRGVVGRRAHRRRGHGVSRHWLHIGLPRALRPSAGATMPERDEQPVKARPPVRKRGWIPVFGKDHAPPIM